MVQIAALGHPQEKVAQQLRLARMSLQVRRGTLLRRRRLPGAERRSGEARCGKQQCRRGA
jgi:hypothetical protein